jgi:O-antigen ligase
VVAEVHSAPGWLQRSHQAAFVALVLALVWAPIPLASNRAWALWLLCVLLCGTLAAVLCTAWVASVPLAAFRRGSASAWPLALLLMYAVLVALQCLPVPGGVRAFVAPGSAGPGPLSVEPFATQTHLLACIAYTAGFTLTVLLANTEQRLRWLMAAVVASGVFQAGLATVLLSRSDTYVFFFMAFAPGDRAMGTFANTDHLAGYLAVCLSLGLGLMLSGKSNGDGAPRGWRQNTVAFLAFTMSRKMLLRLLLVVMVIALVLTRSRGGNAAFFVSLLLTGLLCAWRSPQLRRPAIILVVSMVLVDVVVVGQWIGLDKVVQRLEATSVLRPQDAAKPGADGSAAAAAPAAGPAVAREESLEERLYAARYALAMVKERPLFGFGGGSFYTAFPRFKGPHPLGFYDHAHNDFVEIAADTGLVGLALLLGVAVMAFWRAVQALGDHSPPLARGMAAALVMAILSTAIHSAVDFNLQIPANALTVTVVLALAWCLPQPRRRRSSSGASRGDSGGSTGGQGGRGSARQPAGGPGETRWSNPP